MNRKQLISVLENLKPSGLISLKAEYESEGSTDEDIWFLKELCLSAGLDLHVKIGGVEARRDFRKCLNIGVDGIVAPMVENAFCGSKFIGMFETDEQFFGKDIWTIHRSINIETRYAVAEIDSILVTIGRDINNITIGRSDLASSYFDKNVTQDSVEVTKDIEKVAKAIEKSSEKISLTVGGGVTAKSVEPLISNEYLVKRIKKIETRKCMISTEAICANPKVIDKVLTFEKAYLDNRVNMRHTLDTYSDKLRLEEIERRLTQE